ncbi:MAG: hypothetical protein ACJ79W_01485 [Myxococcales bacterium]
MRVRILGAVAAAAFAGLAFGAVRVRRYVQEDPRFCASCHKTSPEFALWMSGGHGEVACQKCHHSTLDQSVAMLRGFFAGTRPGDGETHALPEIGACASCHLSHDKSWVTVGASRGHRIHAVEQKIGCIRCHGGAVHRFEPASARCKECHGEHAVRAEGMQKLHCFACHDFLSVEGTLRPTRRDCLRCHRAEGVHPARFPDDAPMQFACASCHRPHAPVQRERVACESCHSALAAAGLHGLRAHRECARCHKAHAWRSESADCLRCHRDAASHAARLTCSECHRWQGSPTPASARRGR